MFTILTYNVYNVYNLSSQELGKNINQVNFLTVMEEISSILPTFQSWVIKSDHRLKCELLWSLLQFNYFLRDFSGLGKSPSGMGLISCYYCKGHSNGTSGVSKLQHLANSQLMCLLPWIKNPAVPEHSQLEGHILTALQDLILFAELPCSQSKGFSPFTTLLLLAVFSFGRRVGVGENIDQ